MSKKKKLREWEGCVREYHNPGTRFQEYMKDLEKPPCPNWKPQSYEWLEPKAVDKTFWTYPPCPWEMRVIDEAEATYYNVEIKALEILGTGKCPHGHKPGDTFTYAKQLFGPKDTLIKGSKPDIKMCTRAQSAVGRTAFSMVFDSPQDYGRGEQGSFMQLTCCDGTYVCSQNPIVWQIKRVKKKEPYGSLAPWMGIVKKKGLEYQK